MRFLFISGILLLVLTPTAFGFIGIITDLLSCTAKIADVALKIPGLIAGSVVGTQNASCKALQAKNPTLKCDDNAQILDSLAMMLNGTDKNCTVANTTEAPINITIDAQFNATCATIKLGCASSANVIATVLSLVQCILSNVSSLLGKSVPQLLNNVLGTDFQALVAMVLLIVSSLLGTVTKLLCKIDAGTLMELLCGSLPLLLFGVLSALTASLPTVPAIGVLLVPITQLVTLLVVTLQPVICSLGCLVGAVAGPLLKLLLPPIINLLSGITGSSC